MVDDRDHLDVERVPGEKVGGDLRGKHRIIGCQVSREGDIEVVTGAVAIVDTRKSNRDDLAVCRVVVVAGNCVLEEGGAAVLVAVGIRVA